MCCRPGDVHLDPDDSHIAMVMSPCPCNPQRHYALAHASTVTLALGFVTLTPSCFARASMSTRFREETECAILRVVRMTALWTRFYFVRTQRRKSGYASEAHPGRGCCGRGMLYGPRASCGVSSCSSRSQSIHRHVSVLILDTKSCTKCLCIVTSSSSVCAWSQGSISGLSHLWHRHLAFETSSHAIVNALWLPPA